MKKARFQVGGDYVSDPMSPFENWFVKCVAHCLNNDIGPGDYVWNLQEPGVWVDLYEAGISPAEAVASQFQRQ